MDVRIRLDPADMERLKGQSALKNSRSGAARSGSETGQLFDTPGLTLWQAGHSLTVSRLGSQIWQTLHLRDGHEQRLALDSFAPDITGLASIVGDLQPIADYESRHSFWTLSGAGWTAELTFERGRTTVKGVAHPFCFLRVRRTSGSMAPLSALLRGLAARVPMTLEVGDRWAPTMDVLRGVPPRPMKSKAPPLPPGCSNATALTLIARTSLEHFLINHACLLATGDAETIHQMRVALRRLRSVLSLFKPMLTDPETAALRDQLRWLQRVLGAARDSDVLLAEILTPVDPLFRGVSGYDRLQGEVRRRQQTERDSVLAHLSSPRLSQTLLQLACWLMDVGSLTPLAQQPLRPLALATLSKRYQQVRRQMMRASEWDEEGRHQCRLQIKKLRYALEFFGGLLTDPQAPRFTLLLAAMQDSLGSLNDIATARRLLQQIAQETRDHELAWAAGLVTGWHQHRSGALLADALQDWRKAEKLGLSLLRAAHRSAKEPLPQGSKGM